MAAMSGRDAGWCCCSQASQRSPSLAHRRLITAGRASSKSLPGSISQSQIPSEETGFFRLGGCGSSLTLAGCSGSFLSCHGGGWSGATCPTSPTAKHHSSPFRQVRQTSSVVRTRCASCCCCCCCCCCFLLRLLFPIFIYLFLFIFFQKKKHKNNF